MAGRIALGPRVTGANGIEVEPLDTETVMTIQDALTLDTGDYRVPLPVEEITGLLGPFNTRARVILIHLLKGYSRGMASTVAGVSESTLESWEKRDPEFREATVRAYQMGFRRTFEPELYRRAMAGSDDRGSMRALELVTKARDASYREKSQVAMEVVHRAGESMAKMVNGWTEPSD